MTKEKFEWGLRVWMVIFGITFVIADVVFLAGQEPLFKYINWQAGLLKLPETPAPDGNQWFFLALTNTMMVMIAYMSFALALNPWKYISYLPVLVLSKVTSSVTGLVFYFTTTCRTPLCVWHGGLEGTRYFSNLVVTFSDFPLAIIAFVLYLQSRKFAPAS